MKIEIDMGNDGRLYLMADRRAVAEFLAGISRGDAEAVIDACGQLAPVEAPPAPKPAKKRSKKAAK